MRSRFINVVKLYVSFLKAKPEQMLVVIPYCFFLITQEKKVSFLLTEDEVTSLIGLRNGPHDMVEQQLLRKKK